jgi:anti-sigma factor RsiW
MKHQEIDDNEIIERYVLQRLSVDERQAFQEHFFACDECFDKVQMTARFIAGVRESSVAGALAKLSDETRAVRSSTASRAAEVAAFGWNWLRPAFVLATAASVVLALLLGWLLVNQLPKLRHQLEREKLSREQMERDTQQRLEQATGELEKERQQLQNEKNERAKLATQLEELARQRPASLEGINRPQANAPVVILEALRDSQVSNRLTLPEQAKSATLWIEVEADSRFNSYRLQILRADHQVVDTIPGAKPNAYGALAVNVPARLLQTGN